MQYCVIVIPRPKGREAVEAQIIGPFPTYEAAEDWMVMEQNGIPCAVKLLVTPVRTVELNNG